MRASYVMAIAVVLFVLSRWAKGETAVDTHIVVAGVFAVVVIAALDQGQTEGIAKGFAWLFVIAAAYNVMPAIGKAANTSKAKKASKPTSPYPTMA